MASAYPLDFKKWFDRFQPQTLQIATWLLYISGFFAFIDFLGTRGYLGFARVDKGALGFLVGILVVVAYVGGGFLMANDRKIGYRLALFAALSPFLLRIWILWGVPGISLFDIVTGRNTIGFIFDVALVALLMHPQSKDHQRIYYR